MNCDVFEKLPHRPSNTQANDYRGSSCSTFSSGKEILTCTWKWTFKNSHRGSDWGYVSQFSLKFANCWQFLWTWILTPADQARCLLERYLVFWRPNRNDEAYRQTDRIVIHLTAGRNVTAGFQVCFPSEQTHAVLHGVRQLWADAHSRFLLL